MKRKYSFLIATGILMLLLVPSIGIAEIDDDVMTAGDTFIYKVTEFDVPWQDLIGDMGLMGFPIEELVVDLTGSTLAVKVMALDKRNGYYVMNPYVILGKDVEIPFPEDIPKNVTDIFGNKLVIPEGVGLGIGWTIPGSDYLEFIEDDYMTDDFPGIPFYFDANEWDQYEEMFEDLQDELDAMNIGVDLSVTREDDEFIVKVTGHVGSGAHLLSEPLSEPSSPYETAEYEPDFDVALEIAWHESGNNKGVFKRASGQISGDVLDNDEDLTLNIDISFVEKRHNPLPKQIDVDELITIEMDNASFSYDATGFLDNENLTGQLDFIEDEVDDMIGEEIFEFEITDVDGCYYETTVEFYQGDDVQGLWWNGFTGNPSYKAEYGTGPWEDWQFSDLTGTGGILPLAAPGLTPDWNMWQASILSVSEILEVIEGTVTSPTAESDLADIGLTVNDFDMTYEMRANNDYKVFYFTGVVDVVWDTADWNGYPSKDPERPYADVMAEIDAWMMYTDEGLVAGIGLDVNVDADLENIPVHTEYGSVYNENSGSYDWLPIETYYQNGSLTLDLTADLRNNDIEKLPDPSALPEDTRGENGGGDLITPSFSFIPVLLMFAAVAVIVKRRK